MTDSLIEHEFRDRKLTFLSTPQAPELISEIFSDNYQVVAKQIEFKPGDVIIDIGACEGMFSIYMSILFPDTRIIALEPVPRTYFKLIRNKDLNSCKNIEAYNVGIGKPGQHTATIFMGRDDYSGGSSSWLTHDVSKTTPVECGMISLDACFEMYEIDRCRLLKVDCEGGEYDALYSSHVLNKVDYFTAEVHMNRRLEFESRRMDGLVTWIANQTQVINVQLCKMAE